MRTLAGLALVGCVLLPACSGGTVADASCPALLDWNGVRYQGSGYRLPPKLGERLGEGTFPPCDDGGGAVSEQAVQVFAVEGVDPAAAVATEGDLGVWLAPAYSGLDALYPPVLERVLLGPPCEASAPFVVEGLLEGGTDRLFAVEVDRADRAGRPYRGLLLELVADDGAVLPSVPLGRLSSFDRLRVRVGCREADLPNRTFVAEEVSLVANGNSCGRLGEPCHPSEGAPHPAIVGGSSEQRALLAEIVDGIGPSRLASVAIEPGEGSVGLAIEPGESGLRAEWEAWLVAGAFRDRSHERGLPEVVGLTVGDAWISIEGGPWRGGLDDPRALSREVHRADGRSSVHFDEYGLLRPAGVVPAITFVTNDGAEFLTRYLPRFLEELGDPWRYEGFYFRVESPDGRPLWEWAGSSRLSTGASGTSPGLEACNPVQHLSASFQAAPPDCPAAD
jgi:hypothetical protein